MVSIKSRNNKILVWILGTILAGIWGEVGYKLIWGEGTSVGETTRESTNSSVHQSKAETNYNFMADVRDPFSYRPETQVTKNKPVVHIWVPPPLKLEGIIIKHGKRTAIIGSSDGNTFFESPGDTLYGAKVLSVDDGTVRYRYEKKDTSWSVGR